MYFNQVRGSEKKIFSGFKLPINQVNTDFSILFCINANDTIVYHNDFLTEFTSAKFNCHLLGGKTSHQSLWDFFDDITTEFIYRMILARVRCGIDVRFNFSCDDTNKQRLFEKHIYLKENSDIVFEVRNLSKKPDSPPDNINEVSVKSSRDLLSCSWCDRIHITGDDWQSVDKAINTLQLFEGQVLPKISHGICGDCYKVVSGRILTG